MIKKKKKSEDSAAAANLILDSKLFPPRTFAVAKAYEAKNMFEMVACEVVMGPGE